MLKDKWRRWKHQAQSYAIAYGIKGAVTLLMKTCRVRVHGLENFISAAKEGPCIVMLWHQNMVLMPEVFEKHASQFTYTAFISKSRDGDPLAIFTESYKVGRALRVPHNGRHVALSQMIHALKDKREVVLITPDGPRGPLHQVKPGVAMAAREAGAKIFPFSWEADRFWQLGTWDRMKIPKPFARIEARVGDPVVFAKGETADLQQDVELLQSVLQS